MLQKDKPKTAAAVLAQINKIGRFNKFIWNRPVVAMTPKERVILIGIVQGPNQLYLFDGKLNAKICHSIGSIEGCWSTARDSDAVLLVYRKRVAQLYQERGLRVQYIPNGFIPYDKDALQGNWLAKQRKLISVNVR